MQPSFALTVVSQEAEVSVGPGGVGSGNGGSSSRQTGRWLVPDVDHLRIQMQRIMHDDAFVARARREAPAHVHAHFSWAAAVERLVKALRDGIDEAAADHRRRLDEESCTE